MRSSTFYSTAAMAAAGLGMLGLVAGQATTITSDRTSVIPVTTIVESVVPASSTVTVAAATPASSSSSSHSSSESSSSSSSSSTTITLTSAVSATGTSTVTAGANQLGVDGSGAAAGLLAFCAMGMAMM